MVYERDLEANLFGLHEELSNGTYRHATYTPFTVLDPKQRRIHKATVHDRVVHQAIVNVLEPVFERQFIHDSYSCRIGKGTHAAVRRLRMFLLQASKSHVRTVYALKCDVRKFFDSVDHDMLISLLQRRVHDEPMMKLLRAVIGSFATTPSKGLPLGNLTSQLFANVYLHELDRFVKHELREKQYLRYCDDFVIVSDARVHLEDLIPKLEAFLERHLLLQLHPQKISIRSWTQGVDFLGYVTLPHATILRPKTVRRMLGNACAMNASSYLGLCQHANAHELGEQLRNIVGLHDAIDD